MWIIFKISSFNVLKVEKFKKIGTRNFQKCQNMKTIFAKVIFSNIFQGFSCFFLGVLVSPKINNIGIEAW